MSHPTPAEIDATLPKRVTTLENAFAGLVVYLERNACKPDPQNAEALRCMLEALGLSGKKLEAIRDYFASVVAGG